MTCPDFRPVTLDDKPVFDRFFRLFPPSISEYTFTNLFMWGGVKKIEFARHQEGLLLRAESGGRRYFLPPLGYSDCTRTLSELIDCGKETGVREIALMSEHFRKHLKNPSVRIVPDRDNFDYVYRTASLALLKGWRLDGKRGFIRKFRAAYDGRWAYEPYRPELADRVRDFALKWYAERETSDPSVAAEKAAFTVFLDNFSALSVEGGTLFVDNHIAGFSFGEPLNDTTFVVHFEKADTDFTGGYQMINQQFAEHAAHEKFLFVNREQDMGHEGIRKAKQSYAPVRLLKKYRAFF